MFGESESESPRVPSPWDSLISIDIPPSRALLPASSLSVTCSNPAMSVDLSKLQVVNRIAVGGYGIVERAVTVDGQVVVIKRERRSRKLTRSTLEHEYNVYRTLAGHPAIPSVKTYGQLGNFNAMVMDMHGPSLGDYFRRRHVKFDLRTIVMLGLDMLEILEYIHFKGIIHCDIKPDNILCSPGTTRPWTLHLIDFGLARRYNDPQTGIDHIQPIGTLTYASLGAQLGQGQSRRDDLQSVTYMLLNFVRGSLPWEGLTGGTELHQELRVLEKKRSWTAERLCKDLPKALVTFVKHSLSLSRDEEPPYAILQDQLRKVVTEEEWALDYQCEWIKEVSMPAPEPPLLSQTPYGIDLDVKKFPVHRGDVVLLKVLPLPSLEYKRPSCLQDPSYFPHPDLVGPEWNFPFRPAVVRRVESKVGVDTFRVHVYPLMRRQRGLENVSLSRRTLFRSVQFTSSDPSSSCKVESLPPEDVFVHKIPLRNGFNVFYDQALSLFPQFLVSEEMLAKIEETLEPARCAYSVIYDDDDEETQAVYSRLPNEWYPSSPFVAELASISDLAGESDGFNVDWSGSTGWIADLTRVEHRRREEDRELSNDEDSDSDMEDW